MPHWFQRNILLPVLSVSVAILMVQCSTQGHTTQRANGLTCQTHSSSMDGGLNVTTETDCSLKCPDGRLLSLPEAMASQTKDELNFEFCGVPLPADAGGADSPAIDTSGATPQSLPTALPPLLTGQVDACDPLRGIINFVLAQPPMDLTGKKLVVQIQGQQTPCSISPAFPGELSCKLPPRSSWPAGIIVRVNDQPVNLFPYTGANCELKAGPRAILTKAAGTGVPTQQPTTQPPTQQPPTQQPPTPQPTQPPTQVLPTQPLPTLPLPTQPPSTLPAPTTGPVPTEPPPPTEPAAPTAPAGAPTEQLPPPNQGLDMFLGIAF